MCDLPNSQVQHVTDQYSTRHTVLGLNGISMVESKKTRVSACIEGTVVGIKMAGGTSWKGSERNISCAGDCGAEGGKEGIWMHSSLLKGGGNKSDSLEAKRELPPSPRHRGGASVNTFTLFSWGIES